MAEANHTKRSPATMENAAERLLERSRVNPTTGCREWFGGKNWGYGAIQIDGRNRRAHRVAYEVWVGPIPPGHLVLHNCDNRPCIEPSHLRTGNQAENIQEMYSKGRGVNNAGQRHGMAKITEDDARRAKALIATGARIVDIVKETGISDGILYGIKSGRLWRHV